MKKILTTVAASTLISLGVGTFVAPHADAAARAGCVSKPEFRKVKEGMGLAKVHRIFGTAGERSTKQSQDGLTIEVRTYRTCSSSVVTVIYRNNRLSSKGGSF